MAADRAQHVAAVVEPALAAGSWVVSDRYSGSTIAYQGYGRGLPADELATLVAFAAGGLAADLSILVDVRGRGGGGAAGGRPATGTASSAWAPTSRPGSARGS